MIEEQLREAAKADEQTREQIIHELASAPDATLETLINILRFGSKGLENITLSVVQAIGYPRNVSALPALIDLVGMPNTPGWTFTLHILLDMEPGVVIPALIQRLLDRGRSMAYWTETTEGICMLLAGKHTSQEYALKCGPTLAYLLAQEDLVHKRALDFGYLLDVFAKIGTDGASYALPALITLVERERTSDIGRQAQELIALFSEEALAPYKGLLQGA